MKMFDGMKNFFESLGEYVKNFSNLFLIFLGAFVLVSVIIIFITAFAYECKLTKTIDKINKFLERNPRINDDNLVAFNNMMKASSVPKTLRRQWQQFMLYREHPASYYMSFKHCVENPLRNSTYRQQMTIYKVISYILVALSLVVSTFMAVHTSYSASVLQEVLIIPTTILVLYWVVSMILNLIHSAISGDLFQNYQYFEINIDKAMLTLPEFVDYEVLFSQDEIRRGIPVLFAYLQKRAIQEQQELEKARLKSVDHEKFDFNAAGLDGSLVLDRAMRETENYTSQRKKYMQETERVNNEIGVLENNYREQTKEFQRQVQTSKETVENLKEQLEQAGSTIEINYIKKQMRDEINRQQEAEREFDVLTDKHNQTIKSLNQEINHYHEETQKAKEAMEVAMLSEFNTYSVKVYDNLEKIVDEKMQDRVDDYKNQIKDLESELEEKSEELENIYTRYQEILSQIPEQGEPVMEEYPQEEYSDKKGKKKKKSRKGDDDGMTQPEQLDQYDAQYGEQYYSDNGEYYGDQYQDGQNYENGDGQYYGDNQYYNDNQYDDSQYVNNEQEEYGPEYVPMGENQENYSDAGFDYTPEQTYYPENSEQYVPLQENENQTSNEEYVPLNSDYLVQEDDSTSNGEYVPLNDLDNYNNEFDDNDKSISSAESPSTELNKSEDKDATEDSHFDSSDFDIDFGKPETTGKFEDMDFSFDFGEENKADKKDDLFDDSEDEDDSNESEIPEDEDFDLNKILGLYDYPTSSRENKKEETTVEKSTNEQKEEEKPLSEADVEEKPKRKAGRPRKVVDESEVVIKRKVGRPRKIKVVDEEEKPKRKAGRPRKVVDTSEVAPKRRVGRPRKTEVSDKYNVNRKAGRPKKDVSNPSTTEKRRGRPRKTDSEVYSNKGILGKPKRRVGRPRKNG